MGFFGDLKQDLSQAVNELMPDAEPDNAEVSVETEPGTTDLSDQSLSLEEMLQNIDAIELPEEDDLPKVDEAVVSTVEEPPTAEDLASESAFTFGDSVGEDMLSFVEPLSEDALSLEADDLSFADPVPEDTISAEEPDLEAMLDNVIGQSEALAKEAPVEEPVIEEPAEEPVVEEPTVEEPVVEEPAAEKKIEENKKMKTVENMEEVESNMETENDNVEEKGAEEIMETLSNREPVDETSIITGGMTITGDITSEGSVDIIGVVNGNIDVLGKLNITGHVDGNSKASEVFAEGAKINGEIVSEGAVKIGASTVIIGNISATSAAIAGAVKGDIDVRGPVVLDNTAIVMGNIKSKSVQINNGAVIEGMCSQCYADVSPTAFFDEYKPEKKKASAKEKAEK